MTRGSAAARSLALPGLLLGPWWVADAAGLLPVDAFPGPGRTASALLTGVGDGRLLVATWQTLEAALLGLGLAAVVGVAAGLLVGSSRSVAALTGATVEILRPIPAVALVPVALLTFGFGPSMEVAIVAFACTWPILILTSEAVRSIEPRLLDVARALALSPARRLRSILLPAIVPQVGVALRLAAGLALVVAVTVEIAANPRGLGFLLVSAQQTLDPALAVAALLWLGLVGLAVNTALTATERWAGPPGAARVAGRDA